MFTWIKIQKKKQKMFIYANNKKYDVLHRYTLHKSKKIKMKAQK